MLTVNNLSIQFAGYFLFDEISFTIGKRDRIGLTGLNGTGKSSLLKAINGDIRPETGSIIKQPTETIGYLPQILKVDYNKTVFEEAYTAFETITKLQQKIADYEKQMENHPDYTSNAYANLLNDYTSAQEQFKNLEGHQAKEKLERVLKGLGFQQGDFKRPVKEMSGGWQMRIELAKILLKQPTYIFLDEPTNHLDIESIMWLEDFLKNYPGAVMLVSHDRAFLDNITNRTIEIDLGKIFDYKANYTKYLELRKERKEKLEASFKNQQKYIEHSEMLINKFRAKKNKAKFAQSLITKLERLERIEVDRSDSSAMSFRFQDPPRSGQLVVLAKNMSKSYGDLSVLENVNFEIERGEKVAFVGKNGMGKTTLAKIINNIIPYEGEIKIGHNVDIGYFEQQQAEALDGNKTVFETIDDVATGDMRARVRGLLGAFLFSGDDVDKKVKVLSGGEKSRLAMAKLLLEPFNLLVLDEPTNHLDMRSKEILKNAMNHYTGTIIVVSHDRDFLEGLTTRVFEFSDKKVHQHIGDIYDFLKSKNMDSLNELGLKQKQSKPDKVDEDKATRIKNREAKKQAEKKQKALQNKLNKTEKQVEALELQVKEKEEALAHPDLYKDKPLFDATVKEYDALKAELEKAMTLWESLMEELG